MSVSNKDVEVLSEALFCYYFAIYKKGKQKEYNIELWDDIQNSSDLSKFTANLGITSMVKNVKKGFAMKNYNSCRFCPFANSEHCNGGQW